MALHFPSVSGGQEGVRAITRAAETILGEEVRDCFSVCQWKWINLFVDKIKKLIRGVYIW